MTTAQINVLKRNGRGKEPLNIDKIHSMVGMRHKILQALVLLMLK